MDKHNVDLEFLFRFKLPLAHSTPVCTRFHVVLFRRRKMGLLNVHLQFAIFIKTFIAQSAIQLQIPVGSRALMLLEVFGQFETFPTLTADMRHLFHVRQDVRDYISVGEEAFEAVNALMRTVFEMHLFMFLELAGTLESFHTHLATKRRQPMLSGFVHL